MHVKIEPFHNKGIFFNETFVIISIYNPGGKVATFTIIGR